MNGSVDSCRSVLNIHTCWTASEWITLYPAAMGTRQWHVVCCNYLHEYYNCQQWAELVCTTGLPLIDWLMNMCDYSGLLSTCSDSSGYTACSSNSDDNTCNGQSAKPWENEKSAKFIKFWKGQKSKSKYTYLWRYWIPDTQISWQW